MAEDRPETDCPDLARRPDTYFISLFIIVAHQGRERRGNLRHGEQVHCEDDGRDHLATVKHTSEDGSVVTYGPLEVKGSDSDKYAEIEVMHFSSFEVEANYTVTFSANGGAGGTSTQLAYVDTIVAPNVSREGYTLNGWSSAIAEGATADVTYTAQWTANDSGYSGGDYSYASPATPNEELSIEDEDTPLSDLPNIYADDTETDWYRDAVAHVTALSLMNGARGDNFAPGSVRTRGMIAAILMRLAEGEATDLAGFDDVADDSWYAEAAMAWAVESGILNGDGGNLLDATGTASRAVLAAMLVRFDELYSDIV